MVGDLKADQAARVRARDNRDWAGRVRVGDNKVRVADNRVRAGDSKLQEVDNKVRAVDNRVDVARVAAVAVAVVDSSSIDNNGYTHLSLYHKLSPIAAVY
ncbi:hypothetical protein L1049_016052 [Liquidambar formosana]|uniref:Uncharacterized protein n=1 Tax=Liquidambar formosana TaxID=63359 RepID=A0AAP0RYR7_LIQFO